MAKILDISDALHFEDSPKMKITNDLTVTVSNEAAVILEILPLIENGRSGAGLVTACNKLFSPEDYEAIMKLKLSFPDFMTLIRSAISLVTGDSEGEAQTRATT